ncbi:MAG: hypothetical protein J6R04_04660 [Clostridia bacterium]|nr:hypothetical protein [Clostridia bacterium]
MNSKSSFDTSDPQEMRPPAKGTRVISRILHVGYSALCLCCILLYLGIHCSLLDPDAVLIGGLAVGELALYRWYWLFRCLGAVLIIGLILNLWGMPRKQEDAPARKRWIAWTVAAPIVTATLCLACFIVFATLFGDGWMA